MMNKAGTSILFFILIAFSAQAQFTIYGLNREQANQITQRKAATTDTLELPFRDDLASSLVSVSSDRWLESGDVFVDPSIAINPPNLHVASMDGLKANGDPYNAAGGLGQGDALSSKPIRLGGLGQGDSVYLSFYWELSGLGEMPESTDKLVLQFKSQEGIWNDVFTIDATTPTPAPYFQQTFIKLAPEYLYDGFQFRWVTFCDLNGRFDVWNLDYVYLDKNRSALTKGIHDSGLSNYPGAIFNNYYSVPIQHLRQNPEVFLNPHGNAIRFQSLKNTLPNTNYQFSSRLIAMENGEVISTLHNNTAFSTSNYIGTLQLQAVEPTLIADFSEDNLIDSLVINWQTYSSDPDQDYFDNDTVNAQYFLQNYYALDDGTAEFAGGAKSNGAQVAMKYGIAVEGQRLTHIDICFVNYEGASSPVSLDLIVWKHGFNGLPGQELSRTYAILAKQDSLNAFTSYRLDQFDVINEDTIFIGYEHREDANVFIGIDRNTNFGSFLYSKTSEQSESEWKKNTNVGTPMIRPRFDDRLITGIEDHEGGPPIFYPNPTSGKIFLNKNSRIVGLSNILGRTMNAPVTFGEKVVIDLGELPEGIYIINFIFEGKFYTQKIVKQ